MLTDQQPPTAVVITGLPGTGKSRLALALASTLAERGQPAFVLHTDVLKVTLRTIHPDTLRGPAFAGDIRGKLAQVRPYLEMQVAKAHKEGYTLIIEGTLAAGFRPAVGTVIHLTLDEAERQRRIEAKHESARQALDEHDLTAYQTVLTDLMPPDVIALDAGETVEALVARIVGRK